LLFWGFGFISIVLKEINKLRVQSYLFRNSISCQAANYLPEINEYEKVLLYTYDISIECV